MLNILGVRALECAKRSIGVREGDIENWGKFVQVYLKFVGIFFPASWCAAFVSYKVHQAANELNISTDYPRYGAGGRSCTALYEWAKLKGKITEKPLRGNIFLIGGNGKFHHTGFVDEVSGTHFSTVEGNTDSEGGWNGKEVASRYRKVSACVFVRV